MEMNALNISAIAIAGVFLLAVVAYVIYILFFKKRQTRSEQLWDELKTIENTINSKLQRGKLSTRGGEYKTLLRSWNDKTRQLELQLSIEKHLPRN